MYYINRKDSLYRETVDEFENEREARDMLEEYIMSDPAGSYYISRRCTSDWE